MNIDTGKTEMLTPGGLLEKIASGQRMVSPNKEPKKSCKHCYGRGYEFVTPEGVHIPCRCTK